MRFLLPQLQHNQSTNEHFIWLACTGNAHPRLQNKSQSWSSYCKSNTFRAWWWSVGCARRKSIRRLCNGVWVQSYNWYCQLISRIVSLDGMSKIWLTNTSHDYWRPLGKAEKCEAHGLELLLQLALHDCCRGLRAGTIVILFKLPDRQTLPGPVIINDRRNQPCHHYWQTNITKLCNHY